jgi:hypothetical protein
MSHIPALSQISLPKLNFKKYEPIKDFYRQYSILNHYLKGENAPGWMEEGIPLLEMKKHLEERPAVLTVQ